MPRGIKGSGPKKARKTPVSKHSTVAKTRARKSPQETAANAVSTALAQVARVVIVQFPSNNQGYAYHTRDASIGVDDFCLVISPYADRNCGSFRIPELNGYLAIVRVIDVKETPHSINAASKWIVGKLDISQAIAEGERLAQIEVLQAKIKKARKEAEERVKLEQLRELSPELGTLMDELDALQGRN
jgi:hypothetical protein